MSEKSSPSDSSSFRYLAMQEAELRALMSSDIGRIKDDLSDLYGKLSALKEMQSSDKMALIQQITQEFREVQNRFSDMSLGLSQAQTEIGHHKEMDDLRFKEIYSALESKFQAVSSRLAGLDTSVGNEADLDAIRREFQAFQEETLDQFDEIRGSISALESKHSKLSASTAKTAGAVSKLSWKMALLLSALAWVAGTYGKDALSAIFNAATASAQNQTTSQARPVPQQGPATTIVDTMSTKSH